MKVRKPAGTRSPGGTGTAEVGVPREDQAAESDHPRRSPRLASAGAIREAAAALFLEKGYQGTSLDEIAAVAQVSKQTIYTHFANKEELFSDLVLGNAERVDGFVASLMRTVSDAGDIQTGLRDLARMYIRFVVRPEVMRLRRLVIAEAGRYPELARTYHERVPQKVYLALATLFRDLSNQGQLRIEDPVLAAHHFAWLTIGKDLDHGMFFDPPETSAGADLDNSADAAVRVFLEFYAPRS